MFDDLDTAERKTDDDSTSEKSSQLYRWAHIPAILVFGILIILFHGHPWSWQLAIGGGYTGYVFFFAFGSVFKNSDDFFGDSRAPKYFVKLLIPHLLILVLITAGVMMWFHLRPLLPLWLTHEGRKESLWDLLGWLLLVGAGILQGFWMAGLIKRRFRDQEDGA
jgi:hypothetical protein